MHGMAIGSFFEVTERAKLQPQPSHEREGSIARNARAVLINPDWMTLKIVDALR
jgi:hypothetical protein